MKEAKTGYLWMAALLTMWASPSAAAGEKAPPKPGILVRFTAPTISQVPLSGTLVSSNDREFTLLTFDASTVTLPRDAVTRVEWSAGRRSRSGPFARQGAIALGLAGGVAGAIVYNDDMGERVAGAAITAAGAALWGAVGGALIGAFKHSNEWKEAPIGLTEALAGRSTDQAGSGPPGVQASVSPYVSRSSGGMTVVLRW